MKNPIDDRYAILGSDGWYTATRRILRGGGGVVAKLAVQSKHRNSLYGKNKIDVNNGFRVVRTNNEESSQR